MDCRYIYRFMMNRILYICTFLFCVLTSCEKVPTDSTEGAPLYSGRMTVVYEGEEFSQDNIQVQVQFNQDRTAVDIKLFKVKFVPAMPIRINVEIKDVPLTEESAGVWSFSADDITPWAMGGPYKGYRVDDLEGRITEESVDFELGFFNTKKSENYPTSYSGNLN